MKNKIHKSSKTKLIARVMLVVILVMSNLTLSACNWEDMIAYFVSQTTPKWEAPEGVIETATIDQNGNSITIAHSENFTQDDIEFVAMWHNKKMGANFGMNDVASFSLGDMIRSAQDGSPLYLMQIENPYIIVAYLKPNLPEYELDERNNYFFDSEKYLWYKFKTTDKIPNNIDDNKITIFSYLLYDCTIIKDIGKNLECNYKFKYYLDYNSKLENVENSEKFLAYYHGADVCSSAKKFLSKPLNDIRGCNIYINENGVEYLKIPGDLRAYDAEGNLYVVDDYVKAALWPYEQDYYDILSPYFTYFSHSEFEDKNDGTIFRYVYIKIDDFIKVFFSNK